MEHWLRSLRVDRPDRTGDGMEWVKWIFPQGKRRFPRPYMIKNISKGSRFTRCEEFCPLQKDGCGGWCVAMRDSRKASRTFELGESV